MNPKDTFILDLYRQAAAVLVVEHANRRTAWAKGMPDDTDGLEQLDRDLTARLANAYRAAKLAFDAALAVDVVDAGGGK